MRSLNATLALSCTGSQLKLRRMRCKAEMHGCSGRGRGRRRGSSSASGANRGEGGGGGDDRLGCSIWRGVGDIGWVGPVLAWSDRTRGIVIVIVIASTLELLPYSIIPVAVFSTAIHTTSEQQQTYRAQHDVNVDNPDSCPINSLISTSTSTSTSTPLSWHICKGKPRLHRTYLHLQCCTVPFASLSLLPCPT